MPTTLPQSSLLPTLRVRHLLSNLLPPNPARKSRHRNALGKRRLQVRPVQRNLHLLPGLQIPPKHPSRHRQRLQPPNHGHCPNLRPTPNARPTNLPPTHPKPHRDLHQHTLLRIGQLRLRGHDRRNQDPKTHPPRTHHGCRKATRAGPRVSRGGTNQSEAAQNHPQQQPEQCGDDDDRYSTFGSRKKYDIRRSSGDGHHERDRQELAASAAAAAD
uniref:(northern house mosquito) hypothetical protein n=1 Tax=Culex pipiens TaxID=7175 RepID=A0A8D8JP25_CULPI